METNLYWPFLVYAGAAVGVIAGMLGVSYVLGQRHMERETGEPFESGILQTGSARLRLSIQFYLVGMLFVIFDLEAVFIFAWAIAIRDAGWTGYIGVITFIGILVVGLVYEYKSGALDFGRKKPQTLREESYENSTADTR
jgi:NADH-quinone oxidoreductase subunit A